MDDLLDDDLFLEPAAANAKGGGKFQPKIKPRPKKIASAPKAPALVPSSSQETSQIDQPVDVVNDKLRNQAGSTDGSGISEAHEPIKEKKVSFSDGTRSLELLDSSSEVDVVREVPISKSISIENSSILESAGQVESMEYDLDPFDDILPEPVTKNARASGKFQPRVNPKSGKDLSALAASVSVACSVGENADIFSGLEGLEDVTIQPSSGMVPGTPSLHASSNKDDSVIASDPHASELPVDEEHQALDETSQLDNTAMNDEPLAEDIPLAKLGFRKRKTSTMGEKEKDGKSSRQLRKCSGRQLIDESDEEAHDISGYDAEAHDISGYDAEAHGNPAVAEVEDLDGGQREETKPQKKRGPRKKKPVAEGEKPVRKRKKASKETDQAPDQPPKKFSHSTRRTRRQVDKALLETPEEELELANMPMRDLIMFYLHKERIEDKEAKEKSKKSSTNPSTQNDASHNEEEVFGTERNGDFMGYQGGEPTDMTAPHFNYQTYMDKTRSAKWSKQDDELFYKGVRQFGIDLSMIQLLFPDRTRRQIKLKLKKEERQHPLRLTEAVQNRATDHSQFESIIEQIKKAEEEEEEFEGSESIGVTGEEGVEDISPENNDEATTAGDDGNEEEETAKVDSPMEFDEIDDDFDIGDYRSEY